jgi:hypothetical protein
MNWTCPFCDRDTVLTDQLITTEEEVFVIKNKHGNQKTKLQFLACPNVECQEFTLKLFVGKATIASHNWVFVGTPKAYSIIPSSFAKSFPDYVPLAVRHDYQEACAIQALSPKASATLARRCLQGMIRDFWEIKDERLADAINTLQSKVDPLTWKAIDAVRNVGNIGAHMEKDINLIVDVEPDEAEQLVGLIELLIKDWYLVRHEREQRLTAIVAIGDAKRQARKAKPEAPVVCVQDEPINT